MAGNTLSLPSALDLVAVKPLHQELLRLRGADLAVDAASVERIGGLGLQLLASAEATWAQDGHAFALTNPSPAFVEAVRLAGA